MTAASPHYIIQCLVQRRITCLITNVVNYMTILPIL